MENLYGKLQKTAGYGRKQNRRRCCAPSLGGVKKAGSGTGQLAVRKRERQTLIQSGVSQLQAGKAHSADITVEKWHPSLHHNLD